MAYAKAKGDSSRTGKTMTDEQLSAIIKGLLDDSIDYNEEVGAMRMSATSAYQGDDYGNEVEGRSQVVTREVRDAVEMAKPALMRIFFGAHRVLEYSPTGPEDVQGAHDATVYVEHAVNNHNAGYMEFLSAVDDALIRKTGVFKAYWEESEMPVASHHTGLTQMEIDIIAQDEDVTDIEVTPLEDQDFPAEVHDPEELGPGGQPMQPMPPEPLFDAVVTRIKTKGRLRFEALPPEEFVIHRKARNIETARLVGHHRNVIMSDLIEMGYDEAELEDVAGTDEDLKHEAEGRSIGITTDDTDDAEGSDPSHVEVAFSELWVRVDYDGDGIAELRKVCVAGSGCKVLTNELAEEAPLAAICPSPVAHQAIGNAMAELVEDLQKIKTMILRNTLDSLASAIHPDVTAVTDHVNFDDLLNTEQGRIIRQSRPGMVEYMSQPFIGSQTFPAMQYLDTLVEARTGMNEAAQGLNADALQSTAKSAIENATNAAMGRIEFIARTMIEGGFKRLYKIFLKLIIQNMDRPAKVRLNNRFIQVDPRAWNADMDVDIAMPLSNASLEQRLVLLQTIAEKQELAIQTGGVDNPLAGLPEYAHTLAEITRLGGITDVRRYFKDPTDPANQPEPEPEQPDPQLILAQAEMFAQQNRAKTDQAELELKTWEAVQKDDRERDKMMAELMLKAQEMRTKGAQVDISAIKAEVDKEREHHSYMLGLLQQYQAQRQAEQQAQQAQQQQPPQGAM